MTMSGTTAPHGAAEISEITDDTFAAEVLTAELPVLVEFTADWCPPCRQLAPVLAAIADEERGRLKVVQLDVDRNPRTMIAYGVRSAPTLIVFRDGEPVRSMVGARSKRRLLQELAPVLEA
ncbi:thioredoxin family protein [Streptomyces noursei]|uniref:Thioredoxin n=1 Tax=Streptomyces noursei ATCC 11455 TaxID=316284 RepID=Q58J59_STRNR|nr:thioredoxin [Streptomyces noursei ATCC 11455]